MHSKVFVNVLSVFPLVRADNTIKELEEAFANLDYALAKDLSIKLKYWEGIEDAARAKLRDSWPCNLTVQP